MFTCAPAVLFIAACIAHAAPDMRGTPAHPAVHPPAPTSPLCTRAELFVEAMRHQDGARDPSQPLEPLSEERKQW